MLSEINFSGISAPSYKKKDKAISSCFKRKKDALRGVFSQIVQFWLWTMFGYKVF